MPARSKKPAPSRALPADVTGIRLRFSFQIGWDETPSDGPSYWHVSAGVHDLEDDLVTHHVGSLVFGASPRVVDALILDLAGSGGSEKSADGDEGLLGRVQG